MIDVAAPRRRKRSHPVATDHYRRPLLYTERLRPVMLVGPNKSLGLEVVTFEVLP